MNPNLAYLLAAGLSLFGLYVLVSFCPIGLWLTARFSGIRITLLDLIFMKIRRISPAPIVRSMIIAQKAGLEVNRDELEAHSMAGGNVEQVVASMITAKKKNEMLTFREACQINLAHEEAVNNS